MCYESYCLVMSSYCVGDVRFMCCYCVEMLGDHRIDFVYYIRLVRPPMFSSTGIPWLLIFRSRYHVYCHSVVYLLSD